MNNKTVLVTGATNGIGKITALELARQGARVGIVARDRIKGQLTLEEIKRATNNANLELYIADLSNLQDVRNLAAEFKTKHATLDVLINNAGAFVPERRVTKDGFEMTFALNHLSYFLLTQLLLEPLKAAPAARIINVASSAQAQGRIDFDDLQGERQYSAMKAYFQSKLANVLFTYEQARRLEGTKVTVNALHPGVVRSGFGTEAKGLMGIAMAFIRQFGSITPEQGAQTTLHLASSPEVEGVTGKYFEKKKLAASSKESNDSSIAKRLWTVSEQLTA